MLAPSIVLMLLVAHLFLPPRCIRGSCIQVPRYSSFLISFARPKSPHTPIPLRLSTLTFCRCFIMLSLMAVNQEGQQVSWKERLSHFTWSWFECTMSTGALGTLLSEQPYSFQGLRTIGKVVFIIDLVLFVTFSTLITIRFSLNKGAFTKSLHDSQESFFFGTFWVSIGMIIYCIQAYAVPSCGQWLVTTLEVLFWLYAGCVMLVAVFQYHVIFDLECLSVHEMMPAWNLPLYPFLVLGPVAGTLLYSQPRPSSALPILVGGLAFQGLGWCFAFIQYTLYITRLTSGILPAESERPGMYVAVGPAGTFS